MDIFNAGMESFFTKRLVQREAELRHVLHAANEPMHHVYEAGARWFVDFKETAADQSFATVDEAKAEHAVCALEDVLAARRRLADHSYGQCADCGEAIDIGRLMALAATPCCTACQAIREHRQSASLR